MHKFWTISRKILTGLFVMAALAAIFVGLPVGIIYLLEYYHVETAPVVLSASVLLVLCLAYMIGDADDKMQ